MEKIILSMHENMRRGPGMKVFLSQFRNNAIIFDHSNYLINARRRTK